MKKLFLYISILFFSFLNFDVSNAESNRDIDYSKVNVNNLRPFTQNGKWGFIDNKNNIIISAKFDKVHTFSDDFEAPENNGFSEGLARVDINNKTGYIDKSGKFIIKPMFDAAENFVNGFALVGKENSKGDIKYTYINKNGIPLTKYEYDSTRNNIFSNGLAPVCRYGVWLRCGFINQNGKLVIPLKYHYVSEFVKGIASVETETPHKISQGGYSFTYKNKFINTKDKEILRGKFEPTSETKFVNDVAIVKSKTNEKYGLINLKGNLIVPIKYDWMFINTTQNIIRTELGDKQGIIDYKGKTIVPLVKGMDIWGYSNGLAKVEKNGKFGFINNKGKIVIPIKFDRAEEFIDGYTSVGIGSCTSTTMICNTIKYAYMDTKGKLLTKFEFDRANSFIHEFARVIKYTSLELEKYNSGMIGYIDKKGKLVWQYQ